MTTTQALVLAMLAGLALMLAGIGVAQARIGRARPIGEGHWCEPGTCPVCDDFGAWHPDYCSRALAAPRGER